MQTLREILFSPSMVADRQRCYDRLEQLQKFSDTNPVMCAERLWEMAGILWGSVIKSQIDGKYKFFYSTAFPIADSGDTVLIDNAKIGSQEHVCCYAESDDGINWHRPALNLLFADRFPDNNIIWRWPGYFNDSLSVIEDTIDPDPRRRYKMLIYHHDNDDSDLCGGFRFISPDGLIWERSGEPFPTQDAECLWQDSKSGRYYAFLKDRFVARRSRLLSFSDDFDTWSDPQWCLIPDHGDNEGTNFYNQTAFRMGGMLLGFLNVFDVTTQTTWLELIESFDGLTWRRMPSRVPVLQPSGLGSLDAGGTYPGLSEPILEGETYRYYYYASPRRHSEGQGNEKPTLCMAGFTRNRLVGQQTEGDGYFSTIPIRCPGGRLRLNLAAKEPVQVALKRPGYGSEIDGFTRNECEPVSDDGTHLEVRWKSGRSPADLAGKYVRISVYGKNTVVYGAEFVE